MANQETWKDVVGYEGLYMVSNLGRIKSIDRVVKGKRKGAMKRKGHLMKPFSHPSGYLQIGLCKDGEINKQLLHRIVAISFLKNPENLPEVNHKNSDRKDCSVINIEWCDKDQNMLHAKKLERFKQGGNHYRARIILDTSTGVFYESVKEAATFTRYSYGYILQMMKGVKRNTSSLIYT